MYDGSRVDGPYYADIADPVVIAILDQLAPDYCGYRSPIFEWGHEVTPSPVEMIELAVRMAAAVRAVM